MSSTKRHGGGRPKVVDSPASITLTVDASELVLADTLADQIDQLAGVKPPRTEVLRKALSKGLAAMREDIERRR